MPTSHFHLLTSQSPHSLWHIVWCLMTPCLIWNSNSPAMSNTVHSSALQSLPHGMPALHISLDSSLISLQVPASVTSLSKVFSDHCPSRADNSCSCAHRVPWMYICPHVLYNQTFVYLLASPKRLWIPIRQISCLSFIHTLRQSFFPQISIGPSCITVSAPPV